MIARDGLWSREEIRTQAVQVHGQLDVWDCIELDESCCESSHGLAHWCSISTADHAAGLQCGGAHVPQLPPVHGA